MIGVQPIGPLQLALASGFLLVAAGLSLGLSLGLTRSLTVAAVRAYLQLLALGLVLGWVFTIRSPLLVVLILLIMMAVAAHTLLSRVHGAPSGLYLRGFGAIALSGFTVTFAVTGWVIGVEPWYEPRYVIPIAGMVVGNSLNGMAVCLDRLFGDLRARAGEIEALLALGARPWETVLPSARAALKAGLIPTLNSMSAAGIVFIPGMMTGQVLSGVDPKVAAAYQIVVLLMISAATALGTIVAVLAGYRRSFDRDERFVLAGPGGGGARR